MLESAGRIAAALMTYDIRRDFLKKAALSSGMAAVAPAVLPRLAEGSPNERVNIAANVRFPKRTYSPGPPIPMPPEGERVPNHFRNFIDCVRSRKREDLHCEIIEGHRSTALCHMANISYRTGRKLTFDPAAERFVGDDEANSYLTRKYRAPFVLPEKI